jgi:hypothetical protein
MANSKTIGVAYSDPAIDGGTIDNTVIGGTTTAAGSFTTLAASGATTLNGNCAVGNAAADLVAFHGATATDQFAFTPTISHSSLLEGSVSASAIVGFSRGQFSNFITLANQMQKLLVEKGLMASS